MARYYTNFTEEIYGPIDGLTKKWEVVSNPSTRTNRIELGLPGSKLRTVSGGSNGASFIGYKDTKNYNYANTIETLVEFSVTADVQVPGSYGIVNHKYNGTQGYSLAFLPASNVKSLILYDDKNGVTVGYANYDWANGTRYWVRYRQENNQHFVKIWPSNSTEPAGWLFTATYDIGAISGNTWAGIGTYTANHTIDYFKYAVATNGDTAKAEHEGSGYYNGYEYRKALTIDRTKVGAFSGQYRMLVMHTDPDLRTVANGGKVKRNPLLDIRFEDTSGGKLAHEIARYDPTTGHIEAWVRLESVSSLLNTKIYIYFGKNLTAETMYGMRVGYGSVDEISLERNYVFLNNIGEENQGEMTPLIKGLKDPDMNPVVNPSLAPVTGKEVEGGALTTGYVMYTAQRAQDRFQPGLDANFNENLVFVYNVNGQWYCDPNGQPAIAFTPQSTDFLIAAASWGQGPTTGRAVNYMGELPAGEEAPWLVWAGNPENNIGVVNNNYRSAIHFTNTPDSLGYTHEFSSHDRFSLNFGGWGNMSATNLVDAKVGKGVYLNGSQHLRSKRDVIWNAANTGYISMWFKANSTTGNWCLYSRRTGVGTGDGVNIFGLSGTIRIDYTSTEQWNTGWTAQPNTWYHLVAYTDGSTQKLFINGALVASRASSVGFSTGSNYHHVQLGASVSDATTNGNYFAGTLDEFRMYAGSIEDGFFLTEYNNQNSPSTFYSVGTLEQSTIPIILENAAHAHTVATFALVQQHLLQLAASSHTSTSTTPTPTQVHNISTGNSSHTFSSTSPALAHIVHLIASASTHSVTSTVIPLVTGFAVVPDSVVHGVMSNEIPLHQIHSITASNSLHGHAVSVLNLIEAKSLIVQSNNHAHTVDGIALLQQYIMAIANASHSQIAQTPLLVQQAILQIQNALSGLTSDEVSILQYTLLNQPSHSSHSVKTSLLDLQHNQILAIQDIIHKIKSGEISIVNWDELDVHFGLYKNTYKNNGELTPEELAGRVVLKPTYGKTGQFNVADIDDGTFKPQYKETGKF